MGSCQSAEAGSAVPRQQVATNINNNNNNNNNVAKSNGAKASPPVTPTCNKTDPAETSQASLDDSVKSFGSHKSHNSKKSNNSKKSGGKLGYSSGDAESGSNFSLCDGSSVSSAAESSGKKNPKMMKQSSSVIGLDSMIENRREEGGLKSNIVHMEVPFGKPIEEVYDGVHTGPVLGSGISGMVRLVTHKATGLKYAVKCLDLGLVDTEEGLAQLREEIFIMCQLDHPNIVRLEEVYESHSEIYLVQELCLGGELFDRLDEQPDYHYTEAECARLIKQMLCAVRYLHSKGIIHRDLKLENFLFSSTAQDSELKMIDFGLSKHFRYGEVQHEAVGTPYTVAPEVIRGSYDERCDIWAIGVIAFLLLSGEPPFGGCGGPEPLMTVRSNILRGDFSFEPEDIWELVSPGAKDFIRALLVIDPKDRPTAREAQTQAWLIDWADRTRTEEDNLLNPNVVKALVNFKEFSDMRKLLCEVLSFTLLPDQIKDLRKEFEKMDTDGSGEISLSALKQVLVTNAGAGSLGALTEPEVEDIFNAMRVKKTDPRIHWHEFIAAGLSQCQVDDRNLRLAFDRLDSDHKGYVTLDDIMDLLGSDALHSEEMMRKMWGDSMKAVNCNMARITYEDFLLLMKGQTKDAAENGEEICDMIPKMTSAEKITPLLSVPEGENAQPDIAEQIVIAPTITMTPTIAEDDIVDTPLSMDDDEDLVVSTSASKIPIEEAESSHFMSLTPPGTPTRGAHDYCSPGRMKDKLDTTDIFSPKSNLDLPTIGIPKPQAYIRARSKSMDESDTISHEKHDDPVTPSFTADARRALALPEHDPSQKEAIIQDKNKTPLQANRQLYRAHRQMRISVMEASKRFEEQQARHARDIVLAKEAEEGVSKMQAGLVMRRVNNKTDTSEAVKTYLAAHKKEQQSLMEVANKRGGRGRRTRKKTISDMSGMMGSLSQDELGSISKLALKPAVTSVVQSPPDLSETPPVPKVIETVPESPDEMNDLRKPTVPGEFRKVNDPFGARGKYGNQW